MRGACLLVMMGKGGVTVDLCGFWWRYELEQLTFLVIIQSIIILKAFILKLRKWLTQTTNLSHGMKFLFLMLLQTIKSLFFFFVLHKKFLVIVSHCQLPHCGGTDKMWWKHNSNYIYVLNFEGCCRKAIIWREKNLIDLVICQHAKNDLFFKDGISRDKWLSQINSWAGRSAFNTRRRNLICQVRIFWLHLLLFEKFVFRCSLQLCRLLLKNSPWAA